MAISARELLKHYHIPIENEMGVELRCKCPFHNDATPSLDVNESKLQWICRAGCGGGDLIEFIKRMENVPYPMAKELYETKFSLGETDALTTVHNLITEVEAVGNLEEVLEPDVMARKAFVNAVLMSLLHIPPEHYQVFRDWLWVLIYVESDDSVYDSNVYVDLLYEFSMDIKSVRLEERKRM